MSNITQKSPTCPIKQMETTAHANHKEKPKIQRNQPLKDIT